MLSITQRYGWYEFICFMSLGLWITWKTPGCECRAMDDMNDLGSHEPKLLDVMNNSGLRMMILHYEPMALNAMNNSRLCTTWKTLSCELKALYVMKSLGLWLIRMILGHELKALDVIDNSQLWMTRATPSHELKTLDTMNNSRLWMISMAHDLVTLVL